MLTKKKVGLVCIGVFVTNQLMTGLVMSARKRFGVGHPIAYPSDKDVKSPGDRIQFIATVRAHENYQEWLVISTFIQHMHMHKRNIFFKKKNNNKF